MAIWKLSRKVIRFEDQQNETKKFQEIKGWPKSQAIEIAGMKLSFFIKALNKAVEKLYPLSADIIDFPL